MANKVQEYVRLADETTRQIMSNADHWTSFLTVAARLYKYSYQDQLMIYAQRPNATACATYDLWNDTMHRYVRRGSKGIALLRDTPGGMQLSYVFDVADTGTRESSLEVNPWTLNTDAETMVRQTLSAMYSVRPSSSLFTQLVQLSQQQALAYWETYRNDIIDSVDGSEIKGYDESAIGSSFQSATATGVLYTVSSRCNLEAELTPWDFTDVRAWNTLSASAALGQAISRISGRVLREIERAVKAYERSVENDRTEVQESERLPAAGDDLDRGGTEALGQVRTDEEELSEGASPGAVHETAPEWYPDDASAGNRHGSEDKAVYDDAQADAGEPSDGEPESGESDEVGVLDEQPAAPSRGDDPLGDDLRLTEYEPLSEQMSFFFPTEAEQIALVDSFINQAESEQSPFAFSVPQEVIDEFLRQGSNTTNGQLIVAADFQKMLPLGNIAEHMKSIYHGGYGITMNGRSYSVWYGDDGLSIANGKQVRYAANALHMTWMDAAKRIGEMMDAGIYATTMELVTAPIHERNMLAQDIWYLAQDRAEIGRNYLLTLNNIGGSGFPEQTISLAERLADTDFLSQMLEEMTTFAEAYREDRSLMRLRYYNPEKLVERLRELALERIDFTSVLTEIAPASSFITEDEINAVITAGSNVEGGKRRAYRFFAEQGHTADEKAAFLKREYGTGGRSHAVSGSDHSDESHDANGITLKKQDCPDVKMNWANVANRISELIRKDRYLTSEEKTHYEQLQRRNEERNSGWSEYSTIKEAHPDNLVMYQVGDFFEFYDEDARTAARLLDIRLSSRTIPNAGRVELCGIPAPSLEQYVEKLRDRYDVTISAVNLDTHERNSYTLRSVDHVAERAIDSYEAEFGADGTRVFAEPVRREITQDEIDDALRRWNGDIRSKHAVVRYMKDHAHEPNTAAWLAKEYGADPSKPLHCTVTGTDIDHAMSWSTIQHRLTYLIQSDHFFTEQERDNLDDVDPIAIREALETQGSRGNEMLSQAEAIAAESEMPSSERFHVIDVDRGATPAYAIWDDLKDGYYVDNDGVTEEFSSRWQAEAYLQEIRQTVSEKEAAEWLYVEQAKAPKQEEALLEQAKSLINDFCQQEYESDADFTDLTKIGIAYTTVTDADIPIQVNVNLVDFSVETLLNNEHYETRQYSSLQALIGNELNVLDFSELVAVNEEETLLYAHDEPTNNLAQEIADYEAERMAYREQVIATLTPEQKRTVEAMEVGGFPFRPTERDPIYFGDVSDYPTIFISWEDAYNFINEAELKDTPGLRDRVQAVLHPEPPFPYAVGDTVYLEDNKPFVIESIGRFDISLRDPALSYPIFRAESRENFLRLMERFPQPQKEAAETYNHRRETTVVYPAEQNNLPYDIVIEPLHIEHEQELPTEKERFLPTEEELSSSPISVHVNGEWEYFPNQEAAETAMYEAYSDTVRRNAENFRITDDSLGVGGAKVKFSMNLNAIRLLKQLESEKMQATPEQQEVLSRYVGWGGIPQAFDEHNASWQDEYTELKELLTPEEYSAARVSTLNAHYTSPTVIRAMYQALEQMGFRTGNLLEPSCGVGNFFGLLPETMQDSRLYGVELDSITGRIAKQLYPHANITIAGFETTERKDFFDVAIGNVPFGAYQVSDKTFDRYHFMIHDYFFAKTIEQVRPGGIIAFVTSKGTMDKQTPDVRRYIAQRAELLGAIRLPNNAFKANAGTEVTSDILFLQKREQPMEIEPDWVHLGMTEDAIPVNAYFAEHPNMILGRMVSDDSMYGSGKESACIPFEGANLSEQLAEAIQQIQGVYHAAELPDITETLEPDDTLPADPDVKNYSYTVVNGEVYYRQNSVMVKPALNATAVERVKGLVALRQTVDTIIQAQLGNVDDEGLVMLQEELNNQYDTFTARFGLINARGNATAFSDDPAYYLLCSLEVLNEQGELSRKADMFTKRTIRQKTVITHVDTAAEALAVSIAEKACVDMPYMSELTGKDEDTLASELRGVIFKDFNRSANETYTWRTADEFLSGNVREKLAYYTKALEALEGTDKYAVVFDNVEALRSAQPKDLDASEIDVRLGATWVDKTYIEDFMYETFGTPPYLQHYLRVEYASYTAEWNISGKTMIHSSNVAAYVTYGTGRASAYRILEDTLNLRDVRIYDTVQDAEGKEKRVLNQKETTLAQQKQQAIKEAFRDWIWRDPDRRETLVKRYNELFNSTRPRAYDGQHITFQGMTPTIELREHQRNAVAHILYGGNTLLAHEVGAGKTFEMIAAAMESKRLGLCQKPMFVVPNHLTEQWASEFLRLYPSANILVTTKKDFERSNRQKFCARIATGDYDAVIIGHSQFERIPVSKERQQRLLQEQIDDITEGISELTHHRGEKFTIKQLERTRRQLETRLKKLEAEDRKDQVVTFEQLGVDRLYVDEAHLYKNLFLYTKMRNVAGLSTTEAQKSSDMFLKCRYMDEITDGRGIVFATGTPVSNSMTELYSMQRYLQYSTLQQKNMAQFDAWASTFGETVTAIELAPEGTGYRARTRFAKFFNLPELMTLFKEVADIKTADQLHLPTPNAHYETVVVKPSEYQKEMVQALSERAAKVHSGSVDASIDNMLKITSDGRKLGLDQRLINPLLPDDPGSKVNACVGNILRIWREGQADKLTQLVFSDLSTPKGRAGTEKAEAEIAADSLVADAEETGGAFNIYNDIRSKLIAQGVPQEEIAFIHDANTEVRKKELFAKVRSGQVRILLGSTAKMGAGTNVQDRLVASHDLDCPWRPGDLEQRAGRIVRQGNQNSDVYIYRYVTEGTFDAYLWQTVENKQKFISQIMTSKSPVRSCEDVDETALSYAEIKALCAGDPRIREKMDLDVDVARLRLMKADHQSQQYRLEDQVLKVFPRQIEQDTQLLHGFVHDLETLKRYPLPEEGFVGMTVANRFVTDKEEAGKAILEACKGAAMGQGISFGSYRGLQMSVRFDSFANKFELTLRGVISHRMEVGNDPRGNITRLDNLIEQIPKRMAATQESLETAKQQLAAAKQEIGKPFPQDAELRTKSARLAELDAALNMERHEPRQAPEKAAQER